ncbi:hypothetical protein SRHO_G00001080 [Serrasalmus rhombeus]
MDPCFQPSREQRGENNGLPVPSTVTTASHITRDARSNGNMTSVSPADNQPYSREKRQDCLLRQTHIVNGNAFSQEGESTFHLPLMLLLRRPDT